MIVQRELVLTEMYCEKCGLTYAVPEDWRAEKQRNGGSWSCPNGDGRVYRESDADKYRKQAEQLRAQLTHAEDQRQAAERSASALRGHVTKIRNRIGNGVCPCCNRTFQNLQRHMTSKHPDYKDPS